jgi:hypothetical protein
VPAAAVIPAPIAYVKVVAVKKLVVGSRHPSAGRLYGRTGTIGVCYFLAEAGRCSSPSVSRCRQVYFEKIRVLRAGLTRLNSRAWNNGIGRRFYFVGFRKST